MTYSIASCRALWVTPSVVLLLTLGCGGSGRRPVTTPPSVPARPAATSALSAQQLYESGQYREVVGVSAQSPSAEALWFAAESHLRLGQRDEASREFARLPAVGAGPTWQIVSDLALAELASDAAAIDRARAAAAAYPDDAFVQFQLGLAHMRRDDFAAAVAAFDRCAEIAPRFAYAYYFAGLAYDRLNRTDLTVARFDVFQRLAPAAPEAPEVASILRTVRAR